MAATVTIRSWTGTAGAPTKTDVTSATKRLVTEDAHYSGGTTNPIPVPAAGSNYSFWPSYRLSADTTPTTQINNLRFYSDGTSSSPSGVTWLAQTANITPDAGYRQASGTVGTTGLALNTTNHTGLTAAPVDPFAWTSGSPKTMAGSISNPSTGDFGDFMVMQLVVASTTAATGAITAEQFTVVYDES